MYVQDNGVYPGSGSVVGNSYYVWPVRLFSQMGTNRVVFHCPAARPDSAWDTNVNKTLGGTAPDGTRDPWAVTSQSRFSLAYKWPWKNAFRRTSSQTRNIGNSQH